jgi:hypothetical protein
MPPSPAAASIPNLALKTKGRLWVYAYVSMFWLLLTVLFAVEQALVENATWRMAFARAASDWVPWVMLSPAIFALAMRFPIGNGRVVGPVLLSVGVCVLAVYLAEWSFQYIRPVFSGDPLPNTWRLNIFAPMSGRDAGADRPGQNGYGPPPGMAPAERSGAPQGYPGWTDNGPPPGPPRGGRMGMGPGGRGGRGGLGQGPGGGAGPGQGPMQHMMHFHVPICLFVVMASNAYAYFLQMRDRERKASELARSLAEARLSALQMQLHPHFLFNALNAATALIRRQPDAAEEMIANLSELLRLALNVRDRHEVSMAQELGYLECYLAIERVRFGDRLLVHWEIDESAKNARVPVLLLQPIVENAIRHGIERRNVDVGQVWITTARSDGRLHMSVRDNGPGPQASSSAKRGHGVGLDNTRARLAALHGTDAEARIATGAGGGCIVTIDMPFQPHTPTHHENQSAHR